MKYLIVIEPTGTGFSAFSPDLPGCVATGSNRAEVEQQMLAAMEFHAEGLRAEGIEVHGPAAAHPNGVVTAGSEAGCRSGEGPLMADPASGATNR